MAICFFSLFFTTNVLADSGKAIVSHFNAFTAPSNNQLDAFLYISNIAAEEVTINVTFYDKAGDIISESDNSPLTGVLKAEGVNGYSDNVASRSMQFTLGSNQTMRAWYDNSSTTSYGYAIIEWSRDTSLGNYRMSNALIAHGVMYRNYASNVGYYNIAINNGMPFWLSI